MSANKRLSRKDRRTQRQVSRNRSNNENNIPVVASEKLNFNLKNVNPLTVNQEQTFYDYKDNKHLLLIGTAGTGKSFLSIYLGMRDIIKQHTHNKMIIIRSAVSSRDIGHLPGSNKEKSKVYEAAYYSIFSELFDRGDAYEYLKNKNVVEFINTSFVRGITLDNCIIVVDEIQNMTANELHSVFTRIGKNCRVIFAGDIKQNDLSSKKEQSGFKDFFKVIDKLKDFSIIEFTRDDIVRSNLVREYIIAREELEEKGLIAVL